MNSVCSWYSFLCLSTRCTGPSGCRYPRGIDKVTMQYEEIDVRMECCGRATYAIF